MNRASSNLTSHLLAAASCFGFGELTTQEAAAQMLGGTGQVVFVQYPDGSITRLESTSTSPFRPGEQILIHDVTGTRHATVLATPAPLLTPSTLPPGFPEIQILPPPKTVGVAGPSLEQLVLPPSLSHSFPPVDAPFLSMLQEMITYNGPQHIRSEVVDVAIAAYMTSARSWFGSVPATPPIKLKVEITVGLGSGLTSSLMPQGRSTETHVKVRGTPREIVNVLWHEFSHVAAHNSLGIAIPRWFDEALASSMESEASRNLRRQVLTRARFSKGEDLPLRDLFTKLEPPTQKEELLFYAKSFATVDYLVTHARGETLDDKRLYTTTFVQTVIASGKTLESYDQALQRFYKISNVDELDRKIKSWVGKTYQAK
jgi:hypothetical protein